LREIIYISHPHWLIRRVFLGAVRGKNLAQEITINRVEQILGYDLSREKHKSESG